MEEIEIVIGSWGSYNECNERSLGSNWLRLSEYSDWDEIETELKNQGFILDGIDEELFIQDVDNFPDCNVNWDYMHPKRFFETLKESEVLDNSYKYETFEAFLEVESWDEFERRVESDGANWDDDIYLYRNYDWSELGREMMTMCHEIPDYLDNYIDYESYGEQFRYDGFQEYSNGIIEIR